METVLIATDLSNMSDKVLKAGFDIAKKIKAQVDLTVVINKNLEYFPPDTGLVFSDQWAARQYIAEQELQQIKQKHPGVQINMVVCIGDPPKEIIEQAIENNATMIVMGTHGRGSFYDSILGGTAQYVVRHSPVPVLVVPFNNARH